MKRRALLRRLAAVAAAGCLALNVLAYRHARAMTRFSEGGPRTPRPEALGTSEKLGVLLSGVRLPRSRNNRTPAALGLAFEPRSARTSDGLELEAWYLPRREPRGTVLSFHGYADRKASLLEAARAFHELGWAGLLVDFRGSGGSQGERTSIGFHEAEDVVAALSLARAEGLPAPHVLFGVSMGAAAALRAVGALGARPQALVLQYPFATLSSAVAHRFRSLGAPEPLAPLLVFWGGLQQGFNGFRHAPVDYARGVTVPTLLMQGDRDDRVSLAEARAIHAALAGPKQLEVFEGVGHVSLVAARPEQWTRVVSAFLAALAAPPAAE